MNQNSSASLKPLSLSASLEKFVILLILTKFDALLSPAKIALSMDFKSLMMKASLGDVYEDWLKRILSPGKVCRPEAALLCVSATGMEYFLSSLGFVVDSDGVGGTGRAKTLILASSPAVRYRKSSSLENYHTRKVSGVIGRDGAQRLTAKPSGERSQGWVTVKRTFFSKS